MASSINRQVAQNLLRRLKSKDTGNREAIKIAELIARFQLKSQPQPTSGPSEVQPPEDNKVLDL